MARIALDVGKESEASFHRAFKREYGQPPARIRRLRPTGEQNATFTIRPAWERRLI